MKSPQQDQPESPLTPEQKMALAQQDMVKWRAMAANPNMSPKAATWALEQVRSAQAEVRLRQKAAAYAAEQQNPVEQGDDAALAAVLNLPPSNLLQDQPSPFPRNSQPTP